MPIFKINLSSHSTGHKFSIRLTNHTIWPKRIGKIFQFVMTRFIIIKSTFLLIDPVKVPRVKRSVLELNDK